MVYIKKLEIYGFKSFGFRNIIINLERGLVAVTGPNGSGKSNILDAIMFAIGENSPKALRVDKFQSLFHDSQNSSHRLIRVSLTFENSDRGIPVDSDNVTLTREMEGQTGESQYYLNGKRVAKATLVELLEIVVAAPNKLNIVQQGMITRISELSPEERRKVIEDIVGLSYFDEKRTEALKQLDESDRRLEIALARMSEIRKRIDDLEIERNDQLRYEQIESELKRFKAVKLSNDILIIRKKIQEQSKLLADNALAMSGLENEIQDKNSRLAILDNEKIKFIKDVDATNKIKAEIESKITMLVYETEKNKAIIRESQMRIGQIQRRLLQMDAETVSLNDKLVQIKQKINAEQREELDLSGRRDRIRIELDNVNLQLDRVTSKMSSISNTKRKLDLRLAALIKVRNTLEIATARLEEKVDIQSETLKMRTSQIIDAQNDSKGFQESLKQSISKITYLKTRSDYYEKVIGILKRFSDQVEREIMSSKLVLTQAEKSLMKNEAKANAAKNTSSEDLAISELLQNPSRFQIKGLLHDLIKWDQKYSKAVLAVASDWIKSIVVNDTQSMITIAEYAKIRCLPKLKIIPLDMVKELKPINAPDDTDIIGVLSDFISSNYSHLHIFIFGRVLLTKNSTTAYILARQGYPAVSADGEFFSPHATSISLDFGSKISDMTNSIIIGDSLENLKKLIEKFRNAIEKKEKECSLINSKFNTLASEKLKVESELRLQQGEKSRLEALIAELEKKTSILSNENKELERTCVVQTSDIVKNRHRLSLINISSNNLSEIKKKIEGSIDDKEIARLNLQKNEISKSLDTLEDILRKLMSTKYMLNNESDFANERIKNIIEEKSRLAAEAEQRTNQIKSMEERLVNAEADLKSYRDREQQIIDSSGKSYDVLQDYERTIKLLSEEERRLSKEYHSIEKESALVKKEISDLTNNENRLTNDLSWLGYRDLIENFDAGPAIAELAMELEEIKSKINLRANENYVQVIEGYRSMSYRKNELEMERNSIIVFIEEIIKEKKSVFMEAFEKVNGDIRKTFSDVTGGSAWLEIEDVEDVFSKGILMMVQFPGKPGRESTALSGGEKTMAATIFLLALQSLKPSPFYLMDEVDAHLDAQNTDRLSKILFERSKGGQIIMVTLKDSTVAKANLIYGVYPRQGISQIVKYKNPDQVTIAEIKSEGK